MEGWTKKYVDPRKAAKSWRPSSGSMSPGLRRARQPFLVKNAITGILLDDFDDIDEQARRKIQEEMKERVKAHAATVLSVHEEKDVMERAAGAVVDRVRGNVATSTSSSSVLGADDLAQSIVNEIVQSVNATSRRRGILVGSVLDRRLPGLLDPNSKTLVWGAPPVDNIGTIRRENLPATTL
ncbi:hypothetical protein VNI00_006560 [Paramarasmius palmivorus]|uniref:Uncharacterized protein n=1 Tax=Paramarasmius palmivorus TaxID=297713 RepID=A0AAW0D8D5_9AGAR